MNTSKHILVVEDERVVARDIQRSLTDLGYQVPATAASSDQALHLVRSHCPDLVLMDIRLNGPRDGIETAAILKAEFAVPVVYLTAYADAATVERAKATEPLGYVLKPVKPNELSSTVELALYRHEMESRLRERETWLTTTLNSIGDAVISTDAQGNVSYLNPVAESLTGFRLKDVVGRPSQRILKLVDERSRAPLEDPLVQAMRELKVVRVEGALLSSDGSEYLVKDSSSPIIDARGRVVGAVMVFQNMSEERRSEHTRDRANRLASVANIAREIAQEVNNPLGFTISNVARALDEIRSSDSAHAVNADQDGPPSEGKLHAARVAGIAANLKTFKSADAENGERMAVREVLDWSLDIAPRRTAPRAGHRHFDDLGRTGSTSGEHVGTPQVKGYVLAVDDEAIARTLLQRVLGSEHFLTCPKSSTEALALIEGGLRFDLILCDLIMPTLSGFELYAALLRSHPDQAHRMAFLTGGAVTPQTIEFMASIPNRYLAKPFAAEQLRMAVNTLLHELGRVDRTESAR